jgi:hypothetical protein
MLGHHMQGGLCIGQEKASLCFMKLLRSTDWQMWLDLWVLFVLNTNVVAGLCPSADMRQSRAGRTIHGGPTTEARRAHALRNTLSA